MEDEGRIQGLEIGLLNWPNKFKNAVSKSKLMKMKVLLTNP
jgi:hypothetical protein